MIGSTKRMIWVCRGDRRSLQLDTLLDRPVRSIQLCLRNCKMLLLSLEGPALVFLDACKERNELVVVTHVLLFPTVATEGF